MNRCIKVLQKKRQETGSVLVPILVVAIIVVLVLMWQAGMFSATDTNSAAPTTANSVATASMADESSTINEPQRSAELTTTKTAAPAPFVQEPDGKDEASIQAAADSLIAAHPIELGACRAETDTEEALKCAASAQTVVLEAAFVDYNARRAAGDLAANARGGEVMKRFVAALQKQLQPFENAIN